MNKYLSYSYTRCVNCGTHGLEAVQCDAEADREVFEFDLCIPCEEEIRMLMSPSERLETLYREVGLKGE